MPAVWHNTVSKILKATTQPQQDRVHCTPITETSTLTQKTLSYNAAEGPSIGNQIDYPNADNAVDETVSYSVHVQGQWKDGLYRVDDDWVIIVTRR